MARYIMRLKEGVEPDNFIQESEESIGNEGAQRFNIFKLYDDDSRSVESMSLESTPEVANEIEEIRAKMDRTFVVEIDDKIAASVVVELAGNDGVESIEADDPVEEDLTVNDPLFNKLHGIKNMDCLNAWQQTTGVGVVVAVVDSGLDTTHPDIQANLWDDGNGNHGFNLVSNNNDVTDDTDHGTHVAGTIGASINNAIGVAGVAPSCKLMAIKGLVNGRGTLSVLLKAIRKAVDSGAHVINNSWGPGNRNNPDTDLVLRYAFLHNVPVVFSAGNKSRAVTNTDISSNPHVISVAAVDENDIKPKFSNFGSTVTVCAPGVGILSTVRGNNFDVKSGTSMAAPHVTGLIALMLSKNNQLKPDDIRSILQKSADPVTSTVQIGSGRVNAKKAIDLV